jgi:type IV secretion system protein VirB4
MFKFFSTTDKNYYTEKKEKSFGDMLTYTYHYNDNTILTSNNEFISVIRVEGFPFETADSDSLEARKQMRNNLFKGLSSDDLSIWFHTIRKKQTAFPEGEFNNIFTNELNEQWKRKQDPRTTFINEHYLTIVKKATAKGITGGIASIFAKFNKQEEMEEEEIRYMRESYAQLLETRERIMTSLMSYGARLLGVKKNQFGECSEICQFLSLIANMMHEQAVRMPRSKISNYINTQRIYFGDNKIEILGSNYHKFGAMLSLKEPNSGTFAGMFDALLRLPFEFVLTQSYHPKDRMQSISQMQLQQRRLMQAEDLAVSQIAEIDEALESAMSGTFAFGEHHLTIMALADNLDILENVVSQVVVGFGNIGIMAVRESLNMETAYWAQFPGNHDYIVRKGVINTLNLSSYVSFHNYPSGKISGNHWGDAVTVMNTTSGTPYFFSFHTRDVGHTMIIGPTGGGKTMLLNFLSAQAQKFNPRLFFFDKDRGADIFIRAIKGNYTIIDPGQRCNFNPLLLEDTPGNKNFLVEWVKVLVSSNGEIVTAEEMSIINNAVEGMYRLPKEKRVLRNMSAFLGLEIGNSMATRFKMWHSDGAKAKIFDNEMDMLDFNSGRTFSFDMAEIMKDKVALSPVLLYIFHKITSSLDGTPTMVVLDEAWALIDNPVFAPKIKDWLKVMRKLNAFVVFATQSVEDAAKSSISDTLIQQTATQIFLPNFEHY